MSLKWDFSTVADRLGEAVAAAEAELRLEQAVYGLDARDERAIQELIADRLAAWYGVAREVHYPSSKGNKLTHRMRCDLVLTPPGTSLRVDPTKASLGEVARAEARAVRDRERAERAAAQERAKQERAAARAAAKAAREAERAAAKEAKRLDKLRAKLAEGPDLFGGEPPADACPAAQVDEGVTPASREPSASAEEAGVDTPPTEIQPPPRPAGPPDAATASETSVASTPAEAGDGPRYCDHADALWLEVKVAYQFREGGARHGGYGAQWRQAVVTDLQKMEAEPSIHEGGLVLVVFNESEAILAKDLELFEDVLARKEVLAGFRQVRTLKIQDRIGHAICTIAVWPTVQRQ